jgi:hypothetical protein
MQNGVTVSFKVLNNNLAMKVIYGDNANIWPCKNCKNTAHTFKEY